jgi:hypothetical protein
VVQLGSKILRVDDRPKITDVEAISEKQVELEDSHSMLNMFHVEHFNALWWAWDDD